MKRRVRIFVDSDVIISAKLSNKGAAHLLLNEKRGKLYVSNIQIKELKLACGKLGIDYSQIGAWIKKDFVMTKLGEDIDKVKRRWGNYVADPNDAHIVGGAIESKAKFLLSYNLRHLKGDLLRQELGIVSLTPGQFLQYLRSQ